MICRRRPSAAPDGWLRRWLRLVLTVSPVIGAIVTLPIVFVSAPPAGAQTPGVPAAPTTVFTEGFQNTSSTVPVPLASYSGVNGETYTADPAWLTNCNGEIVNYTMTALPSNCDAGPYGMNSLRSMAYALGKLENNPDPATNNELSAYTDTGNNVPMNPGAGLVQLQTVQPIALPTGTSMHYILFSVDAGSMNCPGNAPELQFNLLSGATVTPAGIPINTCTDPRGGFINVPYPGGTTTNVYTGRYDSTQAVPFTGTSLGVQLVNNQGSGNGNDSSIDN